MHGRSLTSYSMESVSLKQPAISARLEQPFSRDVLLHHSLHPVFFLLNNSNNNSNDNNEVIKDCKKYFCFRLPDGLIETKTRKFDSKYNLFHSNSLRRCFSRSKS